MHTLRHADGSKWQYTSGYQHTYIHIYIHACMHACMHGNIQVGINTHVHTYIHTYMQTWVMGPSDAYDAQLRDETRFGFGFRCVCINVHMLTHKARTIYAQLYDETRFGFTLRYVRGVCLSRLYTCVCPCMYACMYVSATQ